MKNPILKIYSGLPKTIYLLLAARIVNSVGSFVSPLVAMIMTQKVGMTPAQAGFFATIICLTQAPCIISGGKLADTFGRKYIIMIFDTLGAVFYMACAFVRPGMSMAVLILLASDSYAFVTPAFDAVIADVTTGPARKNAFSLIYLGSNLGYSIGPILGGILFNHYLSLMFFIDGFTTLLSTCPVLFITDKKTAYKKPTETEISEDDGINERSSTFHILRHYPALLFFLLITLIYNFTYAQYGFALPLQMDSLFKSSGPQLYSTLITVNGIIVIFFTPLFTKYALRFRSLRAISCGGVLFFLSFLMFSLSKGMYVFYPAIILFTFGEILTTIYTSVFIADNTPPTHRGRINSAAVLIRGTGYAVGPVIMGGVLERTNYFTAWAVIAAIMLAGSAMILILDLNIKKLKTVSRE